MVRLTSAWVFSTVRDCSQAGRGGGLVQGRKLFARGTFPIAVLIGLALAAPARAQDLVDVAALESHLEAAGELAELPTEPDWGVTDSVGSDSTVSVDAPEVPVDSATEAPATEPAVA